MPPEAAATTALASVLHGPRDLRLLTVPLPLPSPTEAQIAIRSTTLCGSDLHYYQDYRNGSIVCTSPLALGHESSGTVTAVGSSVTQLAPGDRVAIECGIPCGSCPRCHEGRYNICPKLKFKSSAKSVPHLWGTLQERINHPAEWVHKLPPGVGFTQGALLEPLAVAVHANERAGSGLKAGAKVLVMGAGAIGLLVAAVATVRGAGEVVIVDYNSGRLELAQKLGWATRTVSPSAMSESWMEQLGADVAFECTGSQTALMKSILGSREGGTVVLIGIGASSMEVPISSAALREVDLKGAFRYGPGCYQRAVEMVARGRIDGKKLEALVSHRVEGIRQVEKAFRIAAGEEKDGVEFVKVECVFGEPQAP